MLLIQFHLYATVILTSETLKVLREKPTKHTFDNYPKMTSAKVYRNCAKTLQEQNHFPARMFVLSHSYYTQETVQENGKNNEFQKRQSG